MKPNLTFETTEQDQGKRLDHFLVEQQLVGLSRARLQKLVKLGHVTINGETAQPKSLLVAGSKIALVLPEAVPTRLIAEDQPLEILFEDEHLLAIDKPAGLTIHPGAGQETGTLVHRLLFHCKSLSDIGGEKRPGIVHRLDKETSGVLLIAKNNQTHLHLTEQFAKRSVEKNYEAIVYGRIDKSSGEIDSAIERHPVDRKKMSSKRNRGRSAYTRYEVLKRYRHFTHLRILPRTGRTHQIRVHLADMGHPVVADKLYGRSASKRKFSQATIEALQALQRHALHARLIKVSHPANGQRLTFEASLPEDMLQLLQSLEASLHADD